VLASRDFGRSWKGVEVPPLRAPSGYPFAYRIGYRLRTAPDGGLYVTFCQSDTTDSSRQVTGRLAFGISRIGYDRAANRFTVRTPRVLTRLAMNAVTLGGGVAPGTTDTNRMRPRWTHGIDVDPDSGRVLVAVADYDLYAPSTRARGTIRVGRSDDRGRTWAWTTVPQLARVGGRRQSAHKPSLVVSGPIVFVGLHGLVDVPIGTKPSRGLATAGHAWTISTDGGRTFRRPRAITGARWDLEALARAGNRAGLRDRAEVLADGRIVYVYADGRSAEPAPDASEGFSQIFLARFAVQS
jgi:hypothetical protein